MNVLTKVPGAQFDNKYFAGELGNMSMRDMFNKSWDVNVSGTHILTHTFIPLLLNSSEPRIVFITSGTANLTDSTNMALPVNRIPPKGWPKTAMTFAAYRSSKTGLNMLMRDWVRVLSEDGVKVFAVSPGLLATNLGGDPDMVRKLGGLEPSVGANVVRGVVAGERDADAGSVIYKTGIQPW
jgi:NAD(P)-dependent dehydrogenase (short-subunit alcohol dehydrogenase family)